MEKENFKLHKVMLDGMDFGLSCKYTVTVDEGENVVTYDYQQTITRIPHEDLTSQFLLLSKAARLALGLQDMDNRLRAVGIVLTGKETKKASIVCEYTTVGGGTIKFRTPKIAYEISDAEYAAILTVAMPKIINEVYAYLYEGKSAEMAEL